MKPHFLLFIFAFIMVFENSMAMPPKEFKPKKYNNQCYRCLSEGYSYCTSLSTCMYPWNQTLCRLPLVQVFEDCYRNSVRQIDRDCRQK